MVGKFEGPEERYARVHIKLFRTLLNPSLYDISRTAANRFL